MNSTDATVPSTSSTDPPAPGGQERTPLVEVSELFVSCSFPMRPDALAMSDCCRRLAATAVVDERGNRLWRCRAHAGQVSPDRTGEVLTQVRRPR